MLTRTIIFVSLVFAVIPPITAQDVQLPQDRTSRQIDGLYENHPQLIAITGAIVTRFPGDAPTAETLLIRNEKIEAIGAGVKVPADALTIKADGLHIYAGLIDAYREIEVPFDANSGTTYWNDQVRPQLLVSESFQMKDLKSEDSRGRGISTVLCAPKDGVIKGQSALILMLDEEAHPEDAVLKNSFALHFHLTVSRGRDGYPNSPMGAVALARQAMYDAKWYHRQLEPMSIEKNRSLDAMEPLVPNRNERGMSPEHSRTPVLFKTSNELFCLRADRFAREFELENSILLGSGHEYRRLNAIVETKRPIILPVNFPKPPEVGTPELATDVSLESLMHWEHAPKNPAALANANVDFCFTTHGLKDDDDFLEKIRHAIKHGLTKAQALAAITTSPAKLFDLENSLGKVESGFLANLVITDKPIFEDDAKILQTWVAGKQFEIEDAESEKAIWELKTADASFGIAELHVGDDIEVVKDPENKTELKHASATASGISGSFKTDKFGSEGWAQISITMTGESSGSGEITLPDGRSIKAEITKTDRKPTKQEKEKSPKQTKDKQPEDIAAISKVNYPFGYAGVESLPIAPRSVLVKNVTLWTCADEGVIEGASVLVADGKIKSVFKNGEALPAAEVTIDGAGGHLTPGIIDCHSHMASDSGINESGQAITAEVRIGDMIDCDDITIYRQLAGGVTTANILHGSANPIGGQNQVIKLRWGALDEEMKFKGAPAGIKFALGENVKQSNWDNPTNRYPQTRMGVEQLFDNAFEEAKLYRAKQSAGGTRVNLELEAIAEIVEGKRWIHCHSYRQDEILALIRLLDRHKIQIGTFQHILEGYKVADEMAKHGAMGSAFSDWWAYKYEVKDAIPHAGALMHRQGVVMSFNSDDAELARHLNKEAAKAVRYGGLSFEEALKFVTINPAKQLRIDDRVGSIEVGKDADFVLWSSHPLSNMAIAEQTWIDGRKYFDRKEDNQRHEEFAKLKLQLIQKILRSGEEMESGDAESTDPAKFWPRYDAFCGHSHHIHGHDHDDDHNHEGHDHE